MRSFPEIHSPSNKPLPARFNMELVETLQMKIAPEVFTTRVVYDGRKNIFSTKLLQFPSGSESQEVYPFAYLKVFIYFWVLTSSI